MSGSSREYRPRESSYFFFAGAFVFGSVPGFDSMLVATIL
jgi:hypothetical protein